MRNTSCSGGAVIALDYDVQGKLKNKNNRLHTFDFGNRLRTIAGGIPSINTSYLYDGLGRRVQDVVGGVSKYSQYSLDGKLMAVSDTRTGIFSEYFYLAGSLVAIRERDAANVYTVKYQHTDALGSPIAVTNASKTVIQTSEFEPYGKVVNRAEVDGPSYTGHVQDASSGLTYMQQRYYDPMIGRFLSVDPVTANSGTGANFNRYWYANNNPYRFKDPDGRKCTTIDGKDSCTFDEFKDKKGDAISREQATSGGSKLAKALHLDRGSRILRAEKAMTTKYSAAKNLAASGCQVSIKGDSKLGIPDQNISGASIVSRMETTRTIANEGENPKNAASLASTSVFVGTGYAPNTPINFWKDGGSGGTGQTFGHEILHTIYSGVGVPNGGWTNDAYNMQHQKPFNDASDSIK